MKSKKKLLLLGVGAMGALAMGVGATSTFAWYTSVASATISKTVETGSVVVEDDDSYGGGNVFFDVKKHTGFSTGDLLITDQAGRSYYRAGSTYNEINSTVTSPWTDRVGSGSFDVKIVDTKNGSSAPSTEKLALAADTYTVKAKISGYGRIALANTTGLGNSDGSSLTIAGGDKADGVLGVAHDGVNGVTVNIASIKITDAGVVTYATYGTDGSLGDYGAWSAGDGVQTAKQSSVVYFAIEASTVNAEDQTNASFASTYNTTVEIIIEGAAKGVIATAA